MRALRRCNPNARLNALPYSGCTKKGTIGVDIKTIQLGWPLGMPLVRKIADGLWETRTHLHGRIARIFFTIVNQTIVLLHGFIKKSQSTPLKELAIATHRLKQIRNTL
ncbi:type II toxin-antitoxin system RelE/ParE family toxin [Pusillimonas minor]|uniref:Type II toxin-antitoxin system RelE/ParE family toxin n=1 Tax=Pusillimonas minor TaxID=2697024 RepID=A0A842HNS0_9BURK|nr:type II toxin-antitoxin system RelE/ParE family toxin [Pusillimonas minor]